MNRLYHNPPIVTPMQEPFMKYVIPHKYVRKKQKIPWRFIFKLCKRSKGTTKDTLDTINCLLEKNNLIPYDHAHPEFDRLKMQGLTIQNVSCASLEQKPIHFPPSLKRKREHLDGSETPDSECSQHSDE